MSAFRKSAFGLSAIAAVGFAAPAQAGTEDYLGEITIVAFTYCPRGTAELNGQILSIASNTALFSLVGTTYGGNGTTTFALPDLRSRVPIHFGQGPGLSNYVLGQTGGQETVTLTVNQIPAHSHTGRMVADKDVQANRASPSASILGRTPGVDIYVSPAVADDPMADGTIQVDNTGGSQPHPNIQPYLTLRYCIAMQGIFPPRD